MMVSYLLGWISHKNKARIGITLDRGLVKAINRVCERRPLSF